MNITDVRIKLMDEEEAGNERCKAFCSITLEDRFVIRDLRIIQGKDGLFVAMPSRKIQDHCPACDGKNHLRSKFCSECGTPLDPERAPRDEDGRAKLHADIAHPINQECRSALEGVVLSNYHAERRIAQLPGYECSYHDID